jgi:hypothetical protein
MSTKMSNRVAQRKALDADKLVVQLNELHAEVVAANCGLYVVLRTYQDSKLHRLVSWVRKAMGRPELLPGMTEDMISRGDASRKMWGNSLLTMAMALTGRSTLWEEAVKEGGKGKGDTLPKEPPTPPLEPKQV